MNRQTGWTADEMMTVVAARRLRGAASCFVGIGLPSTAANLARLIHSPNIVLVYESGTIGAKPSRLPLSIGDGELTETADVVVSLPEIFAYWLQAGRIDVGFLSAAQIDPMGNINTTVIGDYTNPTVRLPGAGGAPEIATACRTVIVILRQLPRTFVTKLDFLTSLLGSGQKKERVVITDLGVLEPSQDTGQLVMTHLHPGVSRQEAIDATGWHLPLADGLIETDPPTIEELQTLRNLKASEL